MYARTTQDDMDRERLKTAATDGGTGMSASVTEGGQTDVMTRHVAADEATTSGACVSASSIRSDDHIVADTNAGSLQQALGARSHRTSLNGCNGAGPSRPPSNSGLDTSRTITDEHRSRSVSHAAPGDDSEEVVPLHLPPLVAADTCTNAGADATGAGSSSDSEAGIKDNAPAGSPYHTTSLNGGNGAGPSRPPSTSCLDTSRTITVQHMSRNASHAAPGDDSEEVVPLQVPPLVTADTVTNAGSAGTGAGSSDSEAGMKDNAPKVFCQLLRKRESKVSYLAL